MSTRQRGQRLQSGCCYIRPAKCIEAIWRPLAYLPSSIGYKPPLYERTTIAVLLLRLRAAISLFDTLRKPNLRLSTKRMLIPHRHNSSDEHYFWDGHGMKWKPIIWEFDWGILIPHHHKGQYAQHHFGTIDTSPVSSTPYRFRLVEKNDFDYALRWRAEPPPRQRHVTSKTRLIAGLLIAISPRPRQPHYYYATATHDDDDMMMAMRDIYNTSELLNVQMPQTPKYRLAMLCHEACLHYIFWWFLDLMVTYFEFYHLSYII